MVLDTRCLDVTPTNEPEAAPPPTVAAADLLIDLLDQASAAPSARDQARLARQLREIIPSASGMGSLWSIVSAPGDARRLLAVQVLGHHRDWLTSRSRVRDLVALAASEADPQVGAALVWCLRHQDAIAQLLSHADSGVAREAALGLSVNQRTVPALLDALLVVPRPPGQVQRVLLQKLCDLHHSLVRDVVDHLLATPTPVCPQRLPLILERLPQLPLFQILVEERQLPDWNSQQEEDAQRSKTWQQLVSAAAKVLTVAPCYELVRYLVTRSGEDDVFTRRHAQLLRAAVRSTDSNACGGLVAHFERLTRGASEDKVARLAQLLVELSHRLEGEPGARARCLLEQWKNRSAGLRLRIYQMQNKLGD
jgi:hypothetical protein